MPLAAKIFEIRAETSLEEIADKLRDYRVVEEVAEEDQPMELITEVKDCLLYTSPSPRDLSTSRMPSSA